MKNKKDLFAQRYAPRMTDEEINRKIEEFCEEGGAIILRRKNESGKSKENEKVEGISLIG